MRQSNIANILTLVALMGCVAVGVFAVWQSQPRPIALVIHPPVPTATPLPTATPAPVLVYVTGAVARPQTLVSLPVGSRVQEALAQAGGTLENADLSRVNLAGIVRDGDQIHVPALNESLSAQPTALNAGVVYVNRATVEELMRLPTIGRVTAEAIVAYREENGRFATLDDLDNVTGIGANTLARIAPLISFED